MLTSSFFIFYMFNVLHNFLEKKLTPTPVRWGASPFLVHSHGRPRANLSGMHNLHALVVPIAQSIRWKGASNPQFLLSRWSRLFLLSWCMDTPCYTPRSNVVLYQQGSMCNCASENVIQFPPRILEHLQSPKWVLWETSGNLAASKLLSNAKFARTLRCFSSMSSNLSMSSFRSAVFLVTFRGSTVKTSTTLGYEIFEFQQHLFQENLEPL